MLKEIFLREGEIMNRDTDPEIIQQLLDEYGDTISVPTRLMIDPKYTQSNNEGKGRLQHQDALLYGYLLKKERQSDDKGEFIEITGKEISTVIGTSITEVPRNMIERLQKHNLVIREESSEVGKPYKLYIKSIT